MSERFEIYVVYKRRYINTLPFLFLSSEQNVKFGAIVTSDKIACTFFRALVQFLTNYAVYSLNI